MYGSDTTPLIPRRRVNGMEMDTGLPEVQTFRARSQGGALLQVLEEVDDREAHQVRPEAQGGEGVKASLKVEIPIKPVPRRVRWDSRNRRMHRSTREAEYMKKLRTYFKDAAEASGINPEREGVRVAVSLTFFIHRPKRLAEAGPPWPHTVRPDLENLVKPVIDAGNGTLWKDDSQIWQIYAQKVYHGGPTGWPFVRLEVTYG